MIIIWGNNLKPTVAVFGNTEAIISGTFVIEPIKTIPQIWLKINQQNLTNVIFQPRLVEIALPEINQIWFQYNFCVNG